MFEVLSYTVALLDEVLDAQVELKHCLCCSPVATTELDMLIVVVKLKNRYVVRGFQIAVAYRTSVQLLWPIHLHLNK
jgi:hypothetical protein